MLLETSLTFCECMVHYSAPSSVIRDLVGLSDGRICDCVKSVDITEFAVCSVSKICVFVFYLRLIILLSVMRRFVIVSSFIS